MPLEHKLGDPADLSMCSDSSTVEDADVVVVDYYCGACVQNRSCRAGTLAMSSVTESHEMPPKYKKCLKWTP
jgi:hypothetical protein